MSKTITITAEEMSRYENNDMKLFQVAGWSNQSSFSNDEVIAVPSDFAEAAGWESAELSADELEAVGDQKISIEVE